MSKNIHHFVSLPGWQRSRQSGRGSGFQDGLRPVAGKRCRSELATNDIPPRKRSGPGRVDPDIARHGEIIVRAPRARQNPSSSISTIPLTPCSGVSGCRCSTPMEHAPGLDRGALLFDDPSLSRRDRSLPANRSTSGQNTGRQGGSRSPAPACPAHPHALAGRGRPRLDQRGTRMGAFIQFRCP